MDVKALTVGQRVLIASGWYKDEGTVIRVGPLGVDVRTDPFGSGALFAGKLYQFNYEGIERDGQSTYEGGIWKVEDLVKAG